MGSLFLSIRLEAGHWAPVMMDVCFIERSPISRSALIAPPSRAMEGGLNDIKTPSSPLQSIATSCESATAPVASPAPCSRYLQPAPSPTYRVSRNRLEHRIEPSPLIGLLFVPLKRISRHSGDRLPGFITGFRRPWFARSLYSEF